jgi:hypothetical protein
MAAPSTILEDTGCSPPCWNQITPGETTKQEVLNILPTLAEVETGSVEDAETLTGGFYNHVSWSFIEHTGDYSGQIFFQDEIVSTIAIYNKKGSLTFDDAVNLLGEPEYVIVFSQPTQKLAIYVINPSKGYALFISKGYVDPGDEAYIRSRNSVKAVHYIDPQLFNNLLISRPIFIPGSLILEHMQPWRGFGEYEITFVNE